MPRISRTLLLAGSLSTTALASETEASLWLSGGYHTELTRDAGRREYRAMLGLSLPWGAWLSRPRTLKLAEGPKAPPDSEAPSDSEASPESTDAVEGSELPTAAEASPPPATASADREEADEPALRPVLGPLLVRKTLERALQARGQARGDARLRALASRSRWSAVLPEMRLRAARTTDESLRLAPTIGDPYRYTRDGGTGVTLEARLSWRLSKLLFTPSELAVERLRQTRQQHRASLQRQVLKLLFAWQRALLASRDPAAFVEQRREAALDALEAELTLNALTGGWFSERRALALALVSERKAGR